MFREEKKIKDLEEKPEASYKAGTQDMSITLSYTKTNKLITALYMVTDIIDKDEPLRNKLRTLGAEIISDMNLVQRNHIGHTTHSGICDRVSEIMSFLDIASAVNIISEMNSSILRKEFLELNQSVLSLQGEEEFINDFKTTNKQINLSEFFLNSPLEEYPDLDRGEVDEFFHPVSQASHPRRGNLISKGHTKISVQKGRTFMKALSDKTKLMSNTNKKSLAPYEAEGFRLGFDKLKKQRREDIINTIKTIGGNATIKDIKDTVKISQNKTNLLFSCGEKTLQRELVSMVKDGVLNKVGEKRWSKYFLK